MSTAVHSLTRNVSRLAGRTFDVLVIGGGVYGLTIAYDAAQRGLSAALIERDDFGSGSSFNHLRTIHGGLRYLQSLDIARARESVRERRTLARIAPHLVRPLPFVLPLTRSLARGSLAMRIGFAIDGLVGRDRNHGVPAGLRLPAGRVMSWAEARQRFPDLPRNDATAAAVWHDYVTPESDRLTWSWARAAAAHGAVIVNYVEARAFLREHGRIVGVRATDRQTLANCEIGARVSVNATGASIDSLLAPLGIQSRMPLAKAMNLVTTRKAGDYALAARSAIGRNLFCVPWHGRALFGTWESTRPVTATDTAATEEEIATFVGAVNAAFPGLELTLHDLSLVHRGIVPARASAAGTVTLRRHERIVDGADYGVEGLLSVAGTKYTTARAVAERVTDRVQRKLGAVAVPCRTASTPLPGSCPDPSHEPPPDLDSARTLNLSEFTITHLVSAFGTDYRRVLSLAATRPEWATPLSSGSPIIGAELVWAIRHELAVTLNDAVIRRTPLGALGYPGDAAATRAAAIIGDELGWSEQLRREEIEKLRAFYRIESR